MICSLFLSFSLVTLLINKDSFSSEQVGNPIRRWAPGLSFYQGGRKSCIQLEPPNSQRRKKKGLVCVFYRGLYKRLFTTSNREWLFTTTIVTDHQQQKPSSAPAPPFKKLRTDQLERPKLASVLIVLLLVAAVCTTFGWAGLVGGKEKEKKRKVIVLLCWPVIINS